MIDTATPPPLVPRRTLPLLAGATFASATAGMLVAGLLQLIAADIGWPPAAAGRLIVYFAFAFALGAPLLGALLARSCRKHVVIRGLALVGLGSLATAAANASPWLELSRIVVAGGAAMTLPGASAIAAFLYPADRSRALAVVLAGTTLAVVLGLPLGTLLGGSFGWRMPLAAAGAIALLAALAVKLWLPGGIVVPPVPLATWRRLLGDARSYPLLGLTLLSIAAVFALYGYIAPFLTARAHIDSHGLAWLLLWYGLVSLATNPLIAPLERRIGTDRLLVACMLLLAAALSLFGLPGSSLATIALAFALWALSSTVFAVVQQARLVTVAPLAGTAMLSLNTSAVFAGQGVGTAIGGVALAFGGLAALPWTGAVLALAAALLMHVSRRVRLD